MALFDRLTKTAQENKQRIVLAEASLRERNQEH